jgi:Ca-activated chloride channel family protein
MSDFHLLHPEFLLLLIPLAIITWGVKRQSALSGQWKNVIAPQLQAYVLKQQAQGSDKKWELPLIFLAAILGILALSGPSWQKQASPVYNSQAGLIIALDLSLSMTAQDVAPTRLQRAKFKITDILQQQADKNIALIAFAGDAHAVSPLTKDSKTILAMLPALDPYIMPVQGSNFVALAKQAIELFEQGKSNPKQLLIISDGIENRDINQASRLLKQSDIELSVLTVGTEQGAPLVKPDGHFFKDANGQVIMPPLEWENLQNFANQSGARIHKLSSNDQDIDYLLSQSAINQDYQESEELAEFDQWLDEGYWLILPMMLLALVGFRKGVFLSVALCMGLNTESSWALDIPDFLLNQDQQAFKQLDNKPQYASELFKDPNWKATSLYKAGDYQGALDIWAQNSDAQSLYNQGNALAKLNKLDDAINAYQQALDKQPDLEDAAFNKELIENMQRDQESSDQQQSDSSDKESSDSDQQKQDQQNSSPSDKNEDGDNSQNQSQDKQQDGQQQEPSSAQSEEEKGSENPNQSSQTDAEKQKEQEMQQLKQQQAQADKKDEGEKQQAQSSKPMSANEQEQQQAMQQWIERIPDDPGGLLRNKFLYQYKNRPQDSSAKERKPW